jgi:pilus assembly protein CpaF
LTDPRFTPPPALSTVFQQEDLTDLLINGTRSVYADLGAGLNQVDLPSPWIDLRTLHTWIVGELSKIGKSWDAKHPFLDALWPGESGSLRGHVVFPPTSGLEPLISLRRVGRLAFRTHSPWLQDPHYAFLRDATRRGESMIISGSTGSGKTTLVNQLLTDLPTHERILALEDTPELCPVHPHFVSLQSRPPNSDGFGEVTLRSLLKQSLRMRPDRLVVGECRGGETLELLQALNTGHQGALSTIHANHPREALRRIELLCLLEGPSSLRPEPLRELLASTLKWIVQAQRVEGKRQITEIARIVGIEGSTILTEDLLKGVVKSRRLS